MTSEPNKPQPEKSSKNSQWWIASLGIVGVVIVGVALLLSNRVSTLINKETVPRETASSASESAELIDPAAQAEAEAAERAQWEAQMQRINEVVQSMSRDELIGDSPTKGPKDAAVVLIKFSDFECPFCAVASARMKDFTANRDDVLYVYKHFPLVSIHPEAEPAARATWAAAQQDQFWLYHDGLFAFQDKLGEDYYVELAEQIGLDVEKFNRDRNSSEAEAAVQKDAELSQQLGLRGTPSFLMTNVEESFLLPGGAPLEIFDEATQRLKAAANQEEL